MGYLTYYLAWFALAYALRYPWLALGVGVIYLSRKALPDPVVMLRNLGRGSRLRQQIEANPANVTARRDLARILIEQSRPGAALKLLEEAQRRDPENAEILYLMGLAQLRSGNPEQALEPLIRSVAIDPRIRYGEAYLCAAVALTRLKRLDDAEDALERYLDLNTSSVEGYVRLSKLRAELGRKDEASRTLREALDTWAQIPGYQKRQQLSWWLRAQLARAGF